MNGFEVLQRALDADNATTGDAAARCASVCVLVAGADETPRVCLIRRATWAADPWSAHIALPGGARHGDETPAETVRREVEEEVGISITDEAELTALPQL